MPRWLTVTNICNGPDCNFGHFMILIKNGINNLVLISTLILVFMLVYVGYIFITSQGNSSAWTRAKEVLGKIIWGYVIILVAWVAVYSITKTLLNDNVTFLLGS